MLQYIIDMKKILLLLLLTMLFCSSSPPPIMQRTSAYDTAIEIAIEDYLKCRLSKHFCAFIVWVDEISEYAPYKINDELIVIDISPAFHRTHITPLVDTIGSVRLPTRHIIKNGKLFYWYDPNYGLTEKMVNVLFQFNVADSIDLLAPSITLDDYTDNYIHHQVDEKTKISTYYFCKNNLNKYKRVITNIATGWYKPPKIKCNQQNIKPKKAN